MTGQDKFGQDTRCRLLFGSSKSEYDLKQKIKEFQTKRHKLMKFLYCLNNLVDQIAGFFPCKYFPGKYLSLSFKELKNLDCSFYGDV